MPYRIQNHIKREFDRIYAYCYAQFLALPVAIRQLIAPALALLSGTIAVSLVTAHWWVGLTPSPITGGWRSWRIPAGWNPAGIAPPGHTLPEPHGAGLLLLGLMLVATAIASFWAVLRARELRAAVPGMLPFILGVTSLIGIVWLLLPVLPSDDIFSYILYGRIGAIYHANALITAPNQFPQDPFLAQVFWRSTRSVYGPAWLLVSDFLTRMAQLFGGSLTAYVWLYKLLGFACHLANGVLIWAILGRIAPRRQTMGTILYAWNPLPLLEFDASGHNDSLMLTCFLLGCWLLIGQRERLALIAWGGSIATKYALIVLMPMWLWHVACTVVPTLTPFTGFSRAEVRRWILPMWQRARAMLWRGALIFGVCGLFLVPFWDGAQTLTALVASPPAQQLGNSLMDTISWPLRWMVTALFHLHPTVARGVVIGGLKLLGTLAFVAVWGWLLVRRAPRDLFGAWGWALVSYLVLASGWFWPWYVTWPLVVVALRPLDRLTMAVLLLAGGALTLYSFLPLLAAPIFGFRSIFVFGPMLGYLVWSMRQSIPVLGPKDESVTAEVQPRLGS